MKSLYENCTIAEIVALINEKEKKLQSLQRSTKFGLIARISRELQDLYQNLDAKCEPTTPQQTSSALQKTASSCPETTTNTSAHQENSSLDPDGQLARDRL
eukprot:Sdes_comp10727_c0_seq2m2411